MTISLETAQAIARTIANHGHTVDCAYCTAIGEDLVTAVTEVDRLSTALNKSNEAYIEAANPGIDMTEVRRIRGGEQRTHRLGYVSHYMRGMRAVCSCGWSGPYRTPEDGDLTQDTCPYDEKDRNSL